MKLGAQLYSVRTFTQTAEELDVTFARLKEMGYECVQLSGAGPIDAETLRQTAEKHQLPIVCTHVPVDRILNDTDAVIAEHRTFGCSVIGLGSIPKDKRTDRETLDAFLEELKVAVAKIEAAGMRFAYHNHAFEFEPYTDGSPCMYDRMLAEFPNWSFILDTYWVEFAGKSAVEYLYKVGADRLANVHFKDMANDEARSICACGNGVLDFEAIYRACADLKVQNVLVEQDNAVKFDDPFAQMATSFAHLRPIVR